MRYSIEITRKAQKALSRIPDEPFPPGTKKLSGREAWRIRVGVYRIIYEVHQDVLSILVVLVGHRKDIYRT